MFFTQRLTLVNFFIAAVIGYSSANAQTPPVGPLLADPTMCCVLVYTNNSVIPKKGCVGTGDDACAWAEEVAMNTPGHIRHEIIPCDGIRVPCTYKPDVNMLRGADSFSAMAPASCCSPNPCCVWKVRVTCCLSNGMSIPVECEGSTYQDAYCQAKETINTVASYLHVDVCGCKSCVLQRPASTKKSCLFGLRRGR